MQILSDMLYETSPNLMGSLFLMATVRPLLSHALLAVFIIITKLS